MFLSIIPICYNGRKSRNITLLTKRESDRQQLLLQNFSSPFTDAPSYSPLWSSLIAPHSMSDYDAWGVATDYIDEKKTLASIFDKLTSDGIDSLKIGQTISRIMDLYNIKANAKQKEWLTYIIEIGV